MSASKIRVAISGGGVAGTSLMHALQQYPHIDAHIFEAAARFKEAGVAFGVNHNAKTALELIGASARECLERAGGVPMNGVRFRVGQGKDSGTLVRDVDRTQRNQTTSIVQRANFLHEFLSIIPEERMHASKKLAKYELAQDGSLVLHFTDGTTHDCDILIGADGIHSTVRKSILGPDDPAASPRNTGWWALMTLQPYEKAKASFGEFVDLDNPRENNWITDGQFYLVNILSHGTTVQFSVVSKDESAENSSQWQKTVTAEEIKRVFTGDELVPQLNKATVDLLCEKPEQPAIFLWEHPPARTYAIGPVAITGDAAHATTAWQGSGGGFSIEDSMIMSTLLGRAKSPKEAEVALNVFDRVRRPRTQELVTSSNTTGVILTGKSESGLDVKKLDDALSTRWDFIIEFDIRRHREEALELFEQELKKA